MTAIYNGMDDTMISSLLRDATVGNTRVTPVEIDMLLDRLEGWAEAAAVRRKAVGR